MRKISYTVLIMTLLTACSEVFNPDINYTEPFLCIQGVLGTKPGTYYVYLNLSRSYNERPYFEGQTDAGVYVIGENGDRISYEELGRGSYSTVITEGNAPEIGNSYYLEVITSDGSVFRSTPQTIVPSPEIKKLYCKADQKTILTENLYGEAYEKEFRGMTLLVETNGILPSDNFYFYRYSAYEEHRSVLQHIKWYYITDIYRHRPLSAKYSNIIHTVNADEYGDLKVRGDELMFIIADDMRNYEPIYPDTFNFISTRFEGLMFKLYQYSISSDAYRYFRDVEDQLDAEGRLFDAAYAQVTGNIECITDPDRKVIGVFYASDISEYIAYLYINNFNRTYSQKLDSFPELWLDTCSWEMPEDWIKPPF